MGACSKSASQKGERQSLDEKTAEGRRDDGVAKTDWKRDFERDDMSEDPLDGEGSAAKEWMWQNGGVFVIVLTFRLDDGKWIWEDDWLRSMIDLEFLFRQWYLHFELEKEASRDSSPKIVVVGFCIAELIQSWITFVFLMQSQ
jgi:hypothetical protein